MEDARFHVVFGAGAGDDGYTLRGVFSREDDAKACEASLHADPLCLSACVDRMTTDQVKQQLLKEMFSVISPDRLRELLFPALYVERG